MQNSANQDGLASAENPIDGLDSIVSEMISLIEHVQGGIAAIEAEIVREHFCSNLDDAANVIILDDLTPRYAKASAALNDCRTSLCTALNALSDKGSARRVIC